MIFSYFLKMISILSKLLFIVVIIKKLPDGVFSEYFFYSTLGLGLGRVLSLASDDSILNLSRGRLLIEGYFIKSFPMLYAFMFVSVFSLVIFDLNFIGSIAFASMLVISSFASGIYRGRRPWVYEYIANSPWVLAIILTIFMSFESSNDIFFNLGLSYLFIFSPFFIISVYKVRLDFSLRPFYFLLRRYELWIYKLLANFQVILSMRAYPLYLTSRADLLADRFSILFSLGEVFWQLYMIVVNRWYSKYTMKGIHNYFEDFKVLIRAFLLINTTAIFLFFILKDMVLIKDFFCLVGICEINYYQEVFIFLFISSFAFIVMIKNLFFIKSREKFFFYVMCVFNLLIFFGFYLLDGYYVISLIYEIIVLIVLILLMHSTMRKI